MVPLSGRQDVSSFIGQQLMRFWYSIDLYAGKRRMELSIKSLHVNKKVSSLNCRLGLKLSTILLTDKYWGIFFIKIGPCEFLLYITPGSVE